MFETTTAERNDNVIANLLVALACQHQKGVEH
jgi:hypothetical protein